MPDAPVEVQIMGAHSLDIVNARDISATGLGVWMPHGLSELAYGAALDLIVTLPGQRPFQARANLRHVQNRSSSYFGVEFTALPDSRRALIESYVAEQVSAHPERSQIPRAS